MEKDKINDIITKYKEGYTQKEIADIYGCSQTTISYFIRKSDYNKRVELNDDEFEKIINRLAAGETLKYLAGEYNYSPNYFNKMVLNYCRDNNVARPYTKQELSLNELKSVYMYLSGYPYDYITLKTNVNKETIYQSVNIFCKNNNKSRDFFRKARTINKSRSVIALHRKGVAVYNLKKKFECSDNYIYKQLGKEKIDNKAFVLYKSDRNKDEIISLFNKGLSISDIVLETDNSKYLVKKIVKNTYPDININEKPGRKKNKNY